MNYEWLFAFVTFADMRNFTHAAKALHISQPALHVQIRKLGESLGVTLYRRDGRQLVLTAEGKRLAAFGRQVREQGHEVVRQLRGEAISGPVVLAAGYGGFLYLLSAVVRRFPKKRWPLKLVTEAGPGAVAAVAEGRAHMAVAAVDECPAGLVTEPLRRVGQHVILPKTHSLAARKRLRPRDLYGAEILIGPKESAHRKMIEQAFVGAEARFEVAVEARGWELLLAFARDGMGLAIVNDFCPVPRGCVAIPLEGVAQVRYMLVHRGVANEALDKLRRLIIDTVAEREESR